MLSNLKTDKLFRCLNMKHSFNVKYSHFKMFALIMVCAL